VVTTIPRSRPRREQAGQRCRDDTTEHDTEGDLEYGGDQRRQKLTRYLDDTDGQPNGCEQRGNRRDSNERADGEHRHQVGRRQRKQRQASRVEQVIRAECQNRQRPSRDDLGVGSVGQTQ